jgi:hypothetical protein
MERIGIEDQTLDRFSLSGQIATHPSSHRPSGQDNILARLGSEPPECSEMAIQQRRLGVGTSFARFGIGVVERQHPDPLPAETVP